MNSSLYTHIFESVSDLVLGCNETRTLEACASDPEDTRVKDAAYGRPVTGLQLMSRAGQACFDFLQGEFRHYLRQPVILCGPGGNGGDGYVIARLFLEKGVKPAVFTIGTPDPESDAGIMRDRFMSAGGEINGELDAAALNVRVSCIVDALFGGGLSRAFDNEHVLGFLKAARQKRIPVFAVDMPSGLSGDTGRVFGACAGADKTLTFFTPKPGHLIADGPDYCGDVSVAQLGVKISDFPADVRYISHLTLPGFFAPNAHKYEYGHTLVLSGPFGRTGAARLSAMAALRMGSGLVTLGSPANAMIDNAAHITAIQLRKIDTAAHLQETLEDSRFNVIVMGPGFGVGEKLREMTKVASARQRRLVLDADALTAIAETPDDFFGQLGPETIMTPHAGEFARLFPDLDLTDPKISKLDQVKKAAARTGATILLKGPDTIIASPNGETDIIPAVYNRSAPTLATAGSGDVLAGVIAGRLAREKDKNIRTLAAEAAFLHQEIGRSSGPGLIAEDLPCAIPGILRRVTD